LSWYLYRVKDMDLFSLFCRQISIFWSNICWRDCLFYITLFWHFCQKLGGSSSVDSYLGLLFSSTGLHICFCDSTKLFLLLWLCSIVWNQILWYLQHCSFCSVLLLSIHSLLCFQMKFRVDFSISVMNVIKILMGIALSM
jgi:hypothetical protein